MRPIGPAALNPLSQGINGNRGASTPRMQTRMREPGDFEMLKRIALAAALSLAFAAPAVASQCPTQMAAIDEALAKSPQLSEADLAEVKRLRAEGEELHAAGKHAESEEALAQAHKLLGIGQ
jgi:hypothetical protein